MNGRDDHLEIYRKTRGGRSSGTGYYLCTAYALWCLENRERPDWTFSEIAYLVYPNRSRNHHKLCKALREQVVERRGVFPTAGKRRGAVYRAEDLKGLLDDRGRARAQLLPMLQDTLRKRKLTVDPGAPVAKSDVKMLNALYGAISKADPLDLEQVLIQVASGKPTEEDLSNRILKLSGGQCHYLLWMFGGEESEVLEDHGVQEHADPVVEKQGYDNGAVSVNGVMVKMPDYQPVAVLPRRHASWRVILAAVAITAITVGWAAKVLYSPAEIEKIYGEMGPDIAAELEIEDTARAHLAKGHQLFVMGDLERAEKYIRLGMNHAGATFGDKARGLYHLAGVRHRQGSFEEAIALYSASEERYAKFGDKAAQQIFLNRVESARARTMLGEYRLGMNLLNNAYDLYSQSSWENKEASLAQWLRIKNRIHVERNETGQAVATAKELMELVSKDNKRAYAEAASTMAFSLAISGNLTQAEFYENQATRLYSSLSYEKGRVYGLLTRVAILTLQNQDASAQKHEIQRYLTKHQDWELSHYLDFTNTIQAPSTI